MNDEMRLELSHEQYLQALAEAEAETKRFSSDLGKLEKQVAKVNGEFINVISTFRDTQANVQRTITTLADFDGQLKAVDHTTLDLTQNIKALTREQLASAKAVQKMYDDEADALHTLAVMAADFENKRIAAEKKLAAEQAKADQQDIDRAKAYYAEQTAIDNKLKADEIKAIRQLQEERIKAFAEDVNFTAKQTQLKEKYIQDINREAEAELRVQTSRERSAERARANAAKQEKLIEQQIAAEERLAVARELAPFNQVARIAQRAKSLFEVISLLRGVTALQNALSQAVLDANKLSLKIAEIRTIDRTSGTSQESLFGGARGISDRFGVDIFKVTEGIYQTVSNQIATGSAAISFVTEAQKFAMTTVSTTQQAVDTLSSTLNAFGLSTIRTNEIAANFFKTIELGRVRASELANSLGDVSNLAKELGVSYQEVNAALALLTIQGISADESITRIRNIVTKLLKPTEEMKKLFHETGFASGEAMVSALGLGGALARIEEFSQGSATEIAALFSNIRAITGQFAFAGDKAQLYNQILKESTQSTKDYDDATKIIAENVGQKLNVEINKIRNTFLDLGTTLGQLTVFFNDNIVTISSAVRVFTELAITLGGAYGIATAVSALVSGIKALQLAMAAARTEAVAFSVSMGNIAGVVTLVGTAILMTVAEIEHAEEERRRKFEESLEAQQEADKKAYANSLRLAEEMVREEVKLGVQRLAAWNTVNNQMASEYAENADDIKLTTRLLTDDFLTYWKDSIKQVRERFNDIRSEMTAIQNQIEVATARTNKRLFDLQIDSLRTPQQKVAAIAAAIDKLSKQATTAGTLRELDAILGSIDELRDKSIAILNDERTGHSQLARIQRDINDDLKRRLSLYDQLNQKLASQRDAAHRDAINAAIQEGRIKTLIGRTDIFSEEDLKKFADVSALKREGASRQDAISQILAMTSDPVIRDQLISNAEQIQKQIAIKQRQIENQLLQEREQQQLQSVTRTLKALGDAYEKARNDLSEKEKQFEKDALSHQKERKEIFKGLDQGSEFSDVLTERLQKLNELEAAAATQIGLERQQVRSLATELLNAQPAALNTLVTPLQIGINLMDTYKRQLQELYRSSGMDNPINWPNILNNFGGARRFAAGGSVDTVPAMLTPGEFVMNRQSSQRFYSQLVGMNGVRGYADGGSVSMGDITVNVTGDRTPERTSQAITAELKRAIRTGAFRKPTGW